jgi:transcription antitermination factor NusG
VADFYIFIIFGLGMVVAPDIVVGDKVDVIGGSYVGRCAVVIKVTTHMYKIHCFVVGNKFES